MSFAVGVLARTFRFLESDSDGISMVTLTLGLVSVACLALTVVPSASEASESERDRKLHDKRRLGTILRTRESFDLFKLR